MRHAKTAEPLELSFAMISGRASRVLDGRAHSRHMAYTVQRTIVHGRYKLAWPVVVRRGLLPNYFGQSCLMNLRSADFRNVSIYQLCWMWSRDDTAACNANDAVSTHAL